MKAVREIVVPDRLWTALGSLAEALGTPREQLVQQALHAFLRFHGVLPPEDPEAPVAPHVVAPRDAVARRVLDTARELERAITPGAAPAAVAGLTLYGEAGVLARVERDRFVIGRGRHCDLVLDSAKVSREHAIIRREGDGWWIEDLGSSNGTWLDRLRIDRRRIADGDVYLICAERIRCVIS